MGSSGAVPQLGEPQQTLWKVVLVTAGSLGFQFSDSASSEIQKLIIDAVARAGLHAATDPDFQKARTNTEKLVREIVRVEVAGQSQLKEEARLGRVSLQQIELSTIHQNAIANAFAALCPGLWPFC